jgi:competence protein ComEC
VNRPLLLCLCAVIAGILLVYFQAPFWAFALLPALFLPAPWLFKKLPVSWLLAALFFFIAGSLLAVPVFSPSPAAGFAGSSRQATGVVDSIPADTEGRTAFILSLWQVDGQPASGKLQTVLYRDEGEAVPLFKAGDVLRVSGEIAMAQGSRNPGGFDYALYLKGQGIDGLFYPQSAGDMTAMGSVDSPMYLVDALRTRLCAVCDDAFSPQQSDLIKGILFGDKAISEDITGTFSNAGISHVLAVSGLHVGFVYLLILGLCRLLGIAGRGRLLLLVPCLVFYCALTGFSVSVVRAALMLSALVLGEGIHEAYDALSGLCLAALIILLIHPAQLFAAGFQLSFGAVLAIIVLYRPALSAWRRHVGEPGKLVQSLGLTLCATAGTMPATLYHFHTLNLVSLAANPVIIPLVGALLMLALPSVAVMALWPAARGILALLPGLLAQGILSLSQFFAGFASLRFYRGAMNAGEIGLLIILSLAAAGYFNWRHRGQRRAVFAALPLLILWVSAAALLPAPLRVTFLDVGQGDSALIETPDGGAYLIDGGGYRSVGNTLYTPRRTISEKVLLPALYAKGITRLDGVFITHNHGDHAQGIEELLAVMPVARIYLTDKYNGRGLTAQSKIPVTRLAQGAVLNSGDGVSIQVLWPDAEAEPVPDEGQNEASMVLRLVYGERSFLFMGDAGLETEPQLQGVDSDVLKIGHHGSDSATGSAFLKAVSPGAAVISVGEGNPFGHPTQRVLKAVEGAGARCYRTDLQGAVEMETDGSYLKIHPYLSGGGQ